jgi:hypothetical protein
MPLPTKLPLLFAFLLFAPIAVAQNNLGELLDAGAKMLSAAEFKEEVVQRVIVGPTPSGGKLEIMYATNGMIQGRGSHPLATGNTQSTISGDWKIDDSGRICASMQIGGGPGGAVSGVALPGRCQVWFKYGDQYFISDSDSDRGARVLLRTLKQ